MIDVLIVGSGLVGASYARLIAERRPETSILVVDLGPQLTDRPGEHITRLAPGPQRTRAGLMSQGPDEDVLQFKEDHLADGTGSTVPGLHLVRAGGLPAAAMASCVGGMGVYWGGVTPRPLDSERVPFIADDDWSEAIAAAERVLGTDHVPFAESVVGEGIRSRLVEVFDGRLPAGRGVRALAIAGRGDQGGTLEIADVADILAPMRLATGDGGFELRPLTLCRSLSLTGRAATSAVLEDRASGRVEEVEVGAVVVCADAFRTPQLLWASGIRPQALGRYLMDHPRTNASIALDRDLFSSPRGELESDWRDCAWLVPFADPAHPFQGNVVREPRLEGAASASLSWSGRTWPRPGNRVVFSHDRTDWCGMPAMTIEFAMTAAEEAEARRGTELVKEAAMALGSYLPGCEARRSAPGWAFHYQGTVRMGTRDDGTSVCDADSKVWGLENVFVGGTGVIPTPTTCNPTLMSVALAARSAAKLVGSLA